MDVRRLAPLALLVAACSANPTPAATRTTPPPPATSPSATATKPSPKPKPKPTSASPTPRVTTPPPVTGEVIGTAGALLTRVEPGETRQVEQGADCVAVFPEVDRPTCAAVKLDGGNLLWVTGRVGGAGAVRLFVQDATGAYAERYGAIDADGTWSSAKVVAAPLAGRGTDGVVVLVRRVDSSATYDLLTWVAGGPLVLRAHRPVLPDARLAPRAGGLDEYALLADGAFAKRRVAWDGRRFRLSAAVRATTAPPR